jgi:hypothetical protein
MEDLFLDGKNEKSDGEKVSILKKIKPIISGPQYELAMNIITVLNVFTVFIRALSRSTSEEVTRNWIILELVINWIMLLEAIGDMTISGPVKAFQYHFRIWPEMLC